MEPGNTIEEAGIFGYFFAGGNVSLNAFKAPINAHIEVTHSPDHRLQNIFLNTFDS